MALALRACVLLGRRVDSGLEAARDRTVAVLQTVLATAAILASAAFIGTGPGLELLHPLAVTMLGGLVTLLLVQGFLLPVLLLGPSRPPAPRTVTANDRKEALDVS
jgi:Cu/Ag efflux pump CusA